MIKYCCVVVVVLLLLSGCSAKNGIVTVEGSTSAEKVLGFVSEGYEQLSGIRVNFNPTGSSAGLEAVKEGRCDIGVISRSLTDEEASIFHSTVIAFDTICLVVNSSNSISELSLQEVSAVFKGEITNWSQLGGADRPIVIIGREAGSGTRDAFETVTNTKGRCVYKQELTSAGDIVSAVNSNVNAIGYTSLESVKGGVNVLQVDTLEPTTENVLAGKYKLARELSVVTLKSRQLPTDESEFYKFLLSNEAAQLISLAGFIPAVGNIGR